MWCNLVPKPPLFLAVRFVFNNYSGHSSASVYYTERKPKQKTGEAWERGYVLCVPLPVSAFVEVCD